MGVERHWTDEKRRDKNIVKVQRNFIIILSGLQCHQNVIRKLMDLKGHWQEKSVSNKHMKGTLGLQ
jgi:hypothetical protein